MIGSDEATPKHSSVAAISVLGRDRRLNNLPASMLAPVSEGGENSADGSGLENANGARSLPRIFNISSWPYAVMRIRLENFGVD